MLWIIITFTIVLFKSTRSSRGLGSSDDTFFLEIGPCGVVWYQGIEGGMTVVFLGVRPRGVLRMSATNEVCHLYSLPLAGGVCGTIVFCPQGSKRPCPL